MHGIEGDRRLALKKIDDRSGFPWLTATKLPELVTFSPLRSSRENSDDLPVRVQTPDGREMEIFGDELSSEIEQRCGTRAQMMHLRQGMFDEATVSVITSDTVSEICRLGNVNPDVRRFRPNVLVRLVKPIPFAEDEWVGRFLQFGEGDDAPSVTVTMPDARCSIVNVDPDSSHRSPEVLKAVVNVHEKNAGVYAVVSRTGMLQIGQSIFVRD